MRGSLSIRLSKLRLDMCIGILSTFYCFAGTNSSNIWTGSRSKSKETDLIGSIKVSTPYNGTLRDNITNPYYYLESWSRCNYTNIEPPYPSTRMHLYEHPHGQRHPWRYYNLELCLFINFPNDRQLPLRKWI